MFFPYASWLRSFEIHLLFEVSYLSSCDSKTTAPVTPRRVPEGRCDQNGSILLEERPGHITLLVSLPSASALIRKALYRPIAQSLFPWSLQGERLGKREQRSPAPFYRAKQSWKQSRRSWLWVIFLESKFPIQLAFLNSCMWGLIFV